MIKGFENLTGQLTAEEQVVVHKIVKRFKDRPGKQNQITNSALCAGLLKHYDLKISEPRLRKVINYIRINSLLPGLCATSNGYFTTNNPKEFEDYIESLKEREAAIHEVRLSAEKDLILLNNSLQHRQKEIKFNY